MDELLEFTRHMVAVGFVRPAQAQIIIAENELHALLQRMESHQPPQPILRMRAEEL